MTEDTQSFELDSRPVFNPAFVPVQVTRDELHVRSGPWSGPALTIRDADRDGVLDRLLDTIDGQTTVATILEEFDAEHREEVRSVLEQLADNDVLRDRRSIDPETPWAHLALKYRFSQADRTRLENRSVLVVSTDEIGDQIVTELDEMGVGSIDLARPHGDQTPTGGGQPLEDDRPRDRDNQVTVHDDPALPALVDEADLVVYTADRPRPIAGDLNELAIDSQTPFFPVEIHGFDGFIGPAVFPGETACYRCFTERTRSNVAGQQGYAAYREEFDGDRALSTATHPAFTRMLAGFASMELLHLLAFGTGYSAGRVIAIDALELSIEANDVLKLPRCECCGPAADVDVQRFVSMEDVVEAGRLRDRARDDRGVGESGDNRDVAEAGDTREGPEG